MSDPLDFFYTDEEREDLLPDEITDLRIEQKESVRADYLAIRAAILALAKGERVARVTIAGKTVDYGAADLPQLRVLRDEYADEMRQLLDVGTNRVFRIKSSKGL